MHFDKIIQYNLGYECFVQEYVIEKLQRSVESEEGKAWFAEFKDATYELIMEQIQDSFRPEQNTTLRQAVSDLEANLISISFNSKAVMLLVEDFSMCSFDLSFDS